MVKWFRPLTTLLLIGLMVAIITQSAAASSSKMTVAAGDVNSFVVTEDGSLWGWGDNHFGQLGKLSATTQLYPYRLPIDNVKAVAAGPTYTLALKSDGTVWAWGNNSYGQLGDGTTSDRLEPVLVKGLSKAIAIAAGGGQSMALLDDGTVWAWGRGFRGELGIGVRSPEDNVCVATPEKVDITDVKAISCGDFHSVALKEDGTVWAWGVGGDGNTINDVPAQVSISDVAAVSCGGSNTFAVKNDGTVWGWGWNGQYQLGTMTFDEFQATPVKANDLKDVVQVSAGISFSLALKKDGTVWAWGENQNGMLGSGYYYGDNVITPIRVNNLTGVAIISAGTGHSLVIKNDGTVWAWGRDYEGQVGPISGDEYTDNSQSYYSVPAPRQVIIGSSEQVPTVKPSVSPTPAPTARPTVSVVPEPSTVPADVKALWDRQYEGRIQYMAAGDAGDIYAFSGNDIYCMDRDGSPKWNLTIPAGWSICNFGSAQLKPGTGSQLAMEAPWPVFGEANGYLYVYGVPDTVADRAMIGIPDGIDITNLDWSLFAISPAGEIAWTLRLPTTLTEGDDTVVHAAGDRVYVYHSYNETVIDRDGAVVYTIPDIIGPAAVDGQGNTYSVPAIGTNRSLSGIDARIASGIVEARGLDGTVLWRKDMSEPILPQYVVREQRSKYGSLPLYQDGALYVPLKQEIVVLDTTGNEKWSKRLDDGKGSTYRLFSLMPLDSAGHVYLTYDNPFDPERTQVYVVSPDGTGISGPRDYRNKYNLMIHTAAKDGVLYDVSDNVIERYDPRNLNDLMVFTVSAYDLISDRELWTYTLPVSATYATVLDKNNLADVLGDYMAEAYEHYPNKGNGNAGIDYLPQIYLYPGEDYLLVNARSANYEVPLVMNSSRCVYSSEIYALSPAGGLVYAKPLDNPATAATAANGTIFFGSGGGKIEAVAIAIGAGLALLAALAIAAKFFLFGTVARARSRLDKNDNRNQVLAYVRAHPGLTLYEVSRCMKMNMGTARYHLFILGLNHKITTFNDGKYVRYFPNSGLYSKEEQLIISLIRRETMGKIIQTLIVTPGLTNTELSQTLEHPNSAISKLTKELCMRGIAVREELADDRTDGKYAFSIREEYAEKTASLSERLNGE